MRNSLKDCKLSEETELTWSSLPEKCKTDYEKREGFAASPHATRKTPLNLIGRSCLFASVFPDVVFVYFSNDYKMALLKIHTLAGLLLQTQKRRETNGLAFWQIFNDFKLIVHDNFVG